MEKEREEGISLQMPVSADVEPVVTYDNFYEKKEHGNLEYPVSVYLIDLYQSHSHSLRWHWHEEMEVILVTDGRARITTDSGDYILMSDQGMILNQNVMHSVHGVEGYSCTFYSLVFHPNFLFGYSHSQMRTQFLLPFQSFTVLKTLLLDHQNSWHESMLELLNKIVSINLKKNFGYEIATKGYLCQFWASLLSQLSQSDISYSPQTALSEKRVKHAMMYIRINHASPITLDDIADSISVSKSECCRCFKRTIQMTPFEYLMKYRIYEASRQILDNVENSRCIADLALSVGFNNISYFNKLFKRYLACTPTEYRKRVAKSVSDTETAPFALPFF